jgi:hypothetical protein
MTQTRRISLRGCIISLALVALGLFAASLWFKLNIAQSRRCTEVHLDAQGNGWRLYTEVQFPVAIPFALAEYTIIYDRPFDRGFERVPLFTVRAMFDKDSRFDVKAGAQDVVYTSPSFGEIHVHLPAEDDWATRYPTVDVRMKEKDVQGLFTFGGKAMSDGP